MKKGWHHDDKDGYWYYLNPVSDGTRGIMCARKRTPDGWLVKEDGSWDEEAGR
jgi:glucan-binding YG repeat protein